MAMALGDGYVQVRTRYNRGKYAYEQRSLRVCHGADQRAYCEWKATRLGWALGGRQINVTPVRAGPGGRYQQYHFTVSHSYFGQVRRWLYPEGRKTITEKVLDMLTPEAVAIWYMDDGHARRNVNKDGFVKSVSTNIATMCSEAEAELVIDWFRQRYDIVFRKRCKPTCSEGHQFFVETNSEGSKKFASLVMPYIPDCMLYKLGHVADVHSQERQTPVGKCTECDRKVYSNRYRGLCSICYSRNYYRKVRRFREGREPRGSSQG